MYNPAAQRLWAVARQTGGSITFDDVSDSDILQGQANGWLRGVGTGRFEATEELRRVGAFSTGTIDPILVHTLWRPGQRQYCPD